MSLISYKTIFRYIPKTLELIIIYHETQSIQETPANSKPETWPAARSSSNQSNINWLITVGCLMSFSNLCSRASGNVVLFFDAGGWNCHSHQQSNIENND